MCITIQFHRTEPASFWSHTFSLARLAFSVVSHGEVEVSSTLQALEEFTRYSLRLSDFRRTGRMLSTIKHMQMVNNKRIRQQFKYTSAREIFKL